MTPDFTQEALPKPGISVWLFSGEIYSLKNNSEIQENEKPDKIFEAFKGFIQKIDPGCEDMCYFLMDVFIDKLLTEEHKKELLNILREKIPVVSFEDPDGIPDMLLICADKFHGFFQQSSEEQKAEIIRAFNSFDFDEQGCTGLGLSAAFLRDLINHGLSSKKAFEFFLVSKDKEGDSFFTSFPVPISNQDSQLYHDFYAANGVQEALPKSGISAFFFSGKIHSLKNNSEIQENEKPDKIFEAFKGFIQKIDPNDVRYMNSFLTDILSEKLLTEERKKDLLKVLRGKIPVIRFEGPDEIETMFLMCADEFHGFFQQSSEEQKAEIVRAFNGFDSNHKGHAYPGLSAAFLRDLINHGLPTQRVIDYFTPEDSPIIKIKLNALFSASFFTAPSDKDSPTYHEFYHSHFVKIVLPELRNRMRLSLLFPIGESESSFEGVRFKRDRGLFLEGLHSVKKIHLDLVQKELKYFIESTLYSDSFSAKEVNDVRDIVSGLMEASAEGVDSIVPVSTDRESMHAEGLLVFEDIVARVNRGARSSTQKSGVTLLKGELSNEDREYISNLESLTKDMLITPGDELDKRIAEMGLEPLGVIEMKGQSAGNCTIATSKAFVLAAYYVAIRKILSKRAPPLEDPELHNQAEALAKNIYKEFTRLYRLKEAKDYLEWHAKTEPAYKYIDEKILAKMIGYFGTESSIREIIETHQLLSRLSKDALELVIKTVTSKNNSDELEVWINTFQPELSDMLRDNLKAILDAGIRKTQSVPMLHQFDSQSQGPSKPKPDEEGENHVPGLH